MNYEEAFRIGNNIRNLRLSYGETLEGLAFAVDLDSPGSISNYEAGIRIPQRDVLIKIAEHYKIPVDVLVNGDIVIGQYSQLPIEDIFRENAIVKLMSFFPFATSGEAAENASFSDGLIMHYRLIRALSEGRRIEKKEFQKCMECYDIAYRKDGIIEAAANMLWWLLAYGLSITARDAADAFRDFQKGEITQEELVRKIQLKEETADQESEVRIIEERNRYLLETESDMTEMLQALKKSPEWSDLAYYYSALRYCWNLVDNGLTFEMNSLIGMTMIVSQAEMGNRFALNSCYRFLCYKNRV